MNQNDPLEAFAVRFLTGRMAWRRVPRQHAITNFGNIISFVLVREPPFQVELFIVPWDTSSFTVHLHPDVDVIEFGLSGEAMLFINGEAACSEAVVKAWLCDRQETLPARIKPTDWHEGYGRTPYAFLSIQHWLHGVEPSSVGLNWIGEASSPEQQALWQHEPAQIGA